jgi:DNA-binding MarR family transcriptional regulator
VVTSFYDQELRSLGLRTTQYTVLQVLSGVGEVSQKTLGEILGADSTTLTRNLRRLDQEGWIVSRPGEDRRQRLWSLTGSGREVLEEARPLWKRAQERFEEALGDDWRRLHGLLDHTTAALQEA